MFDYINICMLNRFIFHHPKAYRYTLTVCLLLVLTGGFHSVMASDEPTPKASVLTPPQGVSQSGSKAAVVQKASTQQKSSVPEGWEQVKQLPGRDGSGPVTKPATPAPSTNIPLGSGDPRTLGRSLNAIQFGDQHWPALLALWNRESNWNPNAKNRSSGACGIPQALPCSKIPDMSTQGQIEWGLQYIESRYGNPSNAWRFWLSHGWY